MSVVRRWLTQVADPIWAAKGGLGYLHYLSDWHQYRHMPGAEPLHLCDTYPQVHDRTATHGFDAHYFFTNGWAMRRIVATAQGFHVDVASQVIFPNLLGGVLPVIFVDYRPLNTSLHGLDSAAGSLLALPFADHSIRSLSCLHVIEHIGLGRYGDPLDPIGTQKSAKELTRVTAIGGNLFIAAPVGQPRLCFNAHRIHSPQAICDMFGELTLIEFSGVHDDGRYVEDTNFSEFEASEYACGLFWFRRTE